MKAKPTKSSPVDTKNEPATDARQPTIVTLHARSIVDADTKAASHIHRFHIAATDDLVELAARWSYTLGSRRRWRDFPEARADMATAAYETLAQLGIGKTQVRKLRDCDHVEVEIHLLDKDDADRTLFDAASDMPWEFLLAAATATLGRVRPFWVSRLLRRQGKSAKAAAAPALPKCSLFVESAPGELAKMYDFDSELRRIRAALDGQQRATESTPHEFLLSQSENVEALAARIRRARPDIIHVAGVDTHQGVRLLADAGCTSAPEQAPGSEIEDGMMVQTITDDAAITRFPAASVAGFLVPEGTTPRLVTLNLYYSAARTARECVLAGAHAAIGFLDEIYDDAAEYFFQAFFMEWREHGYGDLSKAVAEAWSRLQSTGEKLHGTGVVLWVDRSIVDRDGGEAIRLRSSAEREMAPKTEEVPYHLEPDADLSTVFRVELEVPDSVNYSLLHNERPLLKKLALTKLVAHPLHDVAVTVDLHVGDHSFPYRFTAVDLKEPQTHLAHEVKIPLTAALLRSLRERVRTTVYVKVTLGGRTAFEDTRRITLLPVDEWLDDTDENPWLPSFVLPRDPAVRNIIQTARRYLVAIGDDPEAGFSGYQAIEARGEGRYRGVDAQVQAIWTALVHEHRLQYINPPPAYSTNTQRLRTPSEIAASRSGTCVDLALLLASCLEYVDIYPVVFLLSGHAFAGYWRSERFHDAFQRVARIPEKAGLSRHRRGERFVDQYGWRLGVSHYREILAHVHAGELVPLEATGLTTRMSFATAQAEGAANLRSKEEFDSMLDVLVSRRAQPPVTPLPILDGLADLPAVE